MTKIRAVPFCLLKMSDENNKYYRIYNIVSNVIKTHDFLLK